MEESIDIKLENVTDFDEMEMDVDRGDDGISKVLFSLSFYT